MASGLAQSCSWGQAALLSRWPPGARGDAQPGQTSSGGPSVTRRCGGRSHPQTLRCGPACARACAQRVSRSLWTPAPLCDRALPARPVVPAVAVPSPHVSGGVSSTVVGFCRGRLLQDGLGSPPHLQGHLTEDTRFAGGPPTLCGRRLEADIRVSACEFSCDSQEMMDFRAPSRKREGS